MIVARHHYAAHGAPITFHQQFQFQYSPVPRYLLRIPRPLSIDRVKVANYQFFLPFHFIYVSF